MVILGLAVIGSACGGGDQMEETSSATSVAAAPTTAAPTTASPTTASPTTAAPTTANTPTIDLRQWIGDATARFELIAAAHAQLSSAAAEVPSVTSAACNEVANDAQIQEAADFLVGAPDDQLANLARAWSETFFDEMDACIASEFELTAELAAEERPILDEMLERLTELAVKLYLRGGRPSADGS
jgi:hypothetical protein